MYGLYRNGQLAAHHELSGLCQEIAAEYDTWYYNRPEAKAYARNETIWQNLADMIQYFKPSVVFEFGSGLGHLVREVKARNIDIVGSEVSDYAIENSLCPGNIVKIGVIPFEVLPFDDGAFDLVFSSEVMEHVEEEHTDSVIGELYRVCSKHALLTINTFDPVMAGHINMHPRGWWLERFEACGFVRDDANWSYLNSIKCIGWDVYAFSK